MKGHVRLAQRLIQLGVLIAILLAWYISTLPGGINPLLLPAPGPVFQDFAFLVTKGSTIWGDLLVTINEWLSSFFIASISGCILGYIVSRTAYRVRVFDPLFAGLYSIPAILLYPLYLLFFGLGEGSKIAAGTSVAFFPVVLSTIAGLANVDKAYIRAATSMGANDIQMFWSVMLPAAFPVVLTGIRLACIISFLVVLGTETISSLAGLGHRIVSLAENMESAEMFANILFAVFLAFIINGTLSIIEARVRRGAGR